MPFADLITYYEAAINRALGAGWEWAIGQGLTLTLLLGIGAVVCAAIFAVIRAMRRRHSWSVAMASVGRAIADFLVAGVGAIVIMLFIMFGYFFIQDAPKQIAIRDQRIAELGGAPDAPIVLSPLTRLEKERATDALFRLSEFLNGDVTKAIGEADGISRRFSSYPMPTRDYQADAAELFRAGMTIYSTLLGPDNKSGLLKGGMPSIISIMDQAIQIKDRQIIIDFSSSCRSAPDDVSTWREWENSRSSLPPRIMELVRSHVLNRMAHLQEDAERMRVLIEKSNERIKKLSDDLR